MADLGGQAHWSGLKLKKTKREQTQDPGGSSEVVKETSHKAPGT
jgi:hypothetical protein